MIMCVSQARFQGAAILTFSFFFFCGAPQTLSVPKGTATGPLWE